METETNNLKAKSAYEAPTVSVIGTFEEITRETSNGSALDSYVAIHHPIKGHLS